MDEKTLMAGTGVLAHVRQACSRLGLGLTAALIASTAFMGLVLGPFLLGDGGAWLKSVAEAGHAGLLLLMTYLPQVVALAVFWLIVRRMPTAERRDQKVPLSWLAKVFVAGYAIATLAHLATSALNGAAGAADPTESISAVVGTGTIAGMMIPVLLAPVVEELIFRRLLIERLLPYGERVAVVVSAVAFGLYHLNLSQAAFATACGLMFGYVYVKTGRLRYTLVMHMLVNLLSSGIALVSMLAVGAGADAAKPALALGLLAMVGLSAVLVISGIVVALRNRRRIVLPSAPLGGLGAKRTLRAVCVNPGAAVFIVACLASITAALTGIGA